MERLILDLRFTIGLFFAIIGVMLTLHGMIVGTRIEGVNLNLLTGMIFLLFGIGLFWFSIRQDVLKKKRKR